jgi:hypothetical protein
LEEALTEVSLPASPPSTFGARGAAKSGSAKFPGEPPWPWPDGAELLSDEEFEDLLLEGLDPADRQSMRDFRKLMNIPIQENPARVEAALRTRSAGQNP